MKNMKNDKTKTKPSISLPVVLPASNVRRKILKVKYPFHRFKRNNIYDEFHTYDLVDQMRMAEHDHRVLKKQLRWMWNQDEEDEEISVG
jgi:hypothetical protein